MSDPAWASRSVIDGHDGKIWIQAAGVTATPGTADELGFVNAFEFSNEANVTEKGPYINLATVKKTLSSYSASGSMTVEVADGTDAVRELFFTAMSAKTKLKVTVQINPTTGPKDVFDWCIVGVSGSIDPAEGGTYDITFNADTYTHTAASA
jgi:hypothetical protein